MPSHPKSDCAESDTAKLAYPDPDPDFVSIYSHNSSINTESSDARKMPPTNGYTSKVRALDRYKVVGFISSGTYGRVYKAVGHNGMVGEFAIKKLVQTSLYLSLHH